MPTEGTVDILNPRICNPYPSVCTITAPGKTCFKMQLFTKRPTRKATLEHQHLPLHVQSPPVPHLSWDKASALVELVCGLDAQKIFNTFRGLYTETTKAEKLYNEAHLAHSLQDCISDISEEDLESLLAASFCHEIDSESESPLAATVKLFTVVETRPLPTDETKTYERRRIIAWPKHLNLIERKILDTILLDAAHVAFPSVKGIRDFARYRYAATLDMKKFFQNFKLLEGPARYFTFAVRTADGRVRRFTLDTIPTGAVGPPLIAQILVQASCLYAIRTSKADSLTRGVKYDTMIDNIRLVSDDLDLLSRTWQALITILTDIGATIGTANSPSNRPYVYLGLQFTPQSESTHGFTVSLAPKALRKVEENRKIVNASDSTTLGHVLSVFGHCVWAAMATGDLCDEPDKPTLYWIFKFVKRAYSRALSSNRADFMNHNTVIWPSIRAPWDRWLTKLAETSFTPPSLPNQSELSKRLVVIYSDASLKGWGVVILFNNTIKNFCGKWTPAESNMPINRLELKAVVISQRLVEEVIARDGQECISASSPITAIHYIDNTSAICHARSRRAPGFVANLIASAMRHSSTGYHAVYQYVPSALNLADGPSRIPGNKRTI